MLLEDIEEVRQVAGPTDSQLGEHMFFTGLTATSHVTRTEDARRCVQTRIFKLRHMLLCIQWNKYAGPEIMIPTSLE